MFVGYFLIAGFLLAAGAYIYFLGIPVFNWVFDWLYYLLEPLGTFGAMLSSALSIFVAGLPLLSLGLVGLFDQGPNQSTADPNRNAHPNEENQDDHRG